MFISDEFQKIKEKFKLNINSILEPDKFSQNLDLNIKINEVKYDRLFTSKRLHKSSRCEMNMEQECVDECLFSDSFDINVVDIN